MGTSAKLFVLFFISIVVSILLGWRGWKLSRDYNYRCDGWFSWAVSCFVFSLCVLILADQAARNGD